MFRALSTSTLTAYSDKRLTYDLISALPLFVNLFHPPNTNSYPINSVSTLSFIHRLLSFDCNRITPTMVSC